MFNTDYTLFADGSANNSGGGAGCACIVRDNQTLNKIYITAFLEDASSNQAEIFATLLGYAYIRLLRGANGTSVSVASDSEYVLNSSSKWVYKWVHDGTLDIKKNPNYWRAFLDLTTGLQVTTGHVKGHTGHTENELCDKAANWVRTETRATVPKGYIEIHNKKRKKIISSKVWYNINGSSMSSKLAIGYSNDIVEELYNLLLPLVNNSAGAEVRTKEDNVYEEMVNKVKEIVSFTKKQGLESGRIMHIRKQLEDILCGLK